MFKMLAEQTEELHLFMSNLKLTLKQSNDQNMKSFSHRLSTFEKASSIDIKKLEQLIQDMKCNEKSRNMLQESINKMTSKIDEKTDEVLKGQKTTNETLVRVESKSNEIKTGNYN